MSGWCDYSHARKSELGHDRYKLCFVISNGRIEWHLSVISAWALFVVRLTVQGKCESLEGGTTTRGSRFFMPASEWDCFQLLWTHISAIILVFPVPFQRYLFNAERHIVQFKITNYEKEWKERRAPVKKRVLQEGRQRCAANLRCYCVSKCSYYCKCNRGGTDGVQ